VKMGQKSLKVTVTVSNREVDVDSADEKTLEFSTNYSELSRIRGQLASGVSGTILDFGPITTPDQIIVFTDGNIDLTLNTTSGTFGVAADSAAVIKSNTNKITSLSVTNPTLDEVVNYDLWAID